MATRETATRLTRTQAQWFRARWAPVDELDLEELRAMSVEIKLRQLAGLIASGRALGWLNREHADDDEVRDRWQRLRRAYVVEH